MRWAAVILFLVCAVDARAVFSFVASNTIPYIIGTYQGVKGGIPTRAIYTNVPPASGVAGIQTAVNNCPANQAVNLHTNAVYSFSTHLNFSNSRDDISLNMNGSEFQATTDLEQFVLIGADVNWSSAANITAGWIKGGSNLTVSSTSGMAVGQVCLVDNLNEAGLVWDRTAGDARCLGVIHRITAINGSVVTIDPPLIYSGATNTPQMRVLSGHISRTGIIGPGNFNNNGNTVDNGVWIHCAAECFFVGGTGDMRMTNINNFNVMISRAVFTQVGNFVQDNSPEHGPNHAGLLIGTSSTDMGSSFGYYYDGLINKIFPGIEVNKSSGNLFVGIAIYNPFYDGFGQGCGMDLNHGPHGVHNHMENCIFNMIQNDGYFGSGSHNQGFRVWGTGYVDHGLTSNGGLVASNFNSQCLSLKHYSLWEKYAFCAWGWPTFEPTYLVATNDDYDVDLPTIYQFGFPNMGGNNYANTFTFGGHQTTGEDQRLDYRVEGTVFLHACFDTFNDEVVWKDGEDQTPPVSMVVGLETRPDWWPGSLPYPGIKPEEEGLPDLGLAAIPKGYLYVYGEEASEEGGEEDPPAGVTSGGMTGPAGARGPAGVRVN